MYHVVVTNIGTCLKRLEIEVTKTSIKVKISTHMCVYESLFPITKGYQMVLVYLHLYILRFGYPHLHG